MKEIIEALEAAVGPDRSIDGMIAHAVNLHMPDDPEGWPLRYTESIDAAMTLVPEGWNRRASETDKHWWWAELREGYETSYNRVEIGQSPSLPVSICIAALKARSLPAI